MFNIITWNFLLKYFHPLMNLLGPDAVGQLTTANEQVISWYANYIIAGPGDGGPN